VFGKPAVANAIAKPATPTVDWYPMKSNPLTNRWNERGGYRALLKMAFPLILSMGATSILHFIDRMFLTWHSATSIAAAMPAGILSFTAMSLFIGTAGYVSTFVAQYHGAKRPDRIGPSLWQGLYIAAVGGVVIFFLSFAARPIFTFVGHEAAIREEEIIYFSILAKGALFSISSSALAGFFSGRGENWPVMWANFIMMAVNVVLDYLFIFGKAGLPAMGIRGAAYATIIAAAAACLFYLTLVFRKKYNSKFKTLSGFRFDRKLIGRMIKFGLPSGIQFFIDIAGFSIFILLIGRIGTDELAATNIALNINTLAFMPMLGFGVAISVMVGQFQGEGKSDIAERSVYSGAHLCLCYMILIAISYVAVPQVFIAAFAAKADPGTFDEIRQFITVLLRFVAVFTVFDTLNIVFASALKGAGDTRFVMIMIVVLSICGLTIPTIIAISFLNANIFAAWYIISGYVILLAISFLLRFLTGKWKTMKVIEKGETSIPVNLPEVPAAETEI
jgi:multidrug resistance protein, MATE family